MRSTPLRTSMRMAEEKRPVTLCVSAHAVRCAHTHNELDVRLGQRVAQIVHRERAVVHTVQAHRH